MEQYNVGTGNEAIFLAVDISTLGLAASRAILVDVASSAPGTSVASSHDASGDIPSVLIGKAADIRNRRLTIVTKVDLIGKDYETRKKEFEQMTAKYDLKSGLGAEARFTNPEKKSDAEFQTGYLYMHIDLIA